MEVNQIALDFIGFQSANWLSTARENLSSQITPGFPAFRKESLPQTLKLRLQNQQSTRKKALNKRIEERTKAAQMRLQKIKSKQQLNTTANQKMWYPVSQEKEYKSATKVQKFLQIKSTDTEFQLKKKNEGEKENNFKAYHRGKKLSELPKIKQLRTETKQESFRRKSQDVDLVGFGIFSEKKKTKAFLKKLGTILNKQFWGGVDLKCQQELQRLEMLILNEVGNEATTWLTSE